MYHAEDASLEVRGVHRWIRFAQSTTWQSWDCVAHSQNPEIVCQILKPCKCNAHSGHKCAVSTLCKISAGFLLFAKMKHLVQEWYSTTTFRGLWIIFRPFSCISQVKASNGGPREDKKVLQCSQFHHYGEFQHISISAWWQSHQCGQWSFPRTVLPTSNRKRS